MPILSFDFGIRTFFTRFLTAFRMRVSMSAIGSVIVMTQILLGTTETECLPARLGHARDQTLGRELAEAAAAALEFPVEAAIPSAEETAVVGPAREGVLLQVLRDR